MRNYTRVLQTGFDIAVTDNVPQEELDSLAVALATVINEWIDINNKACECVCVNGVHWYEDLTDQYDMKEINKTFNKENHE